MRHRSRQDTNKQRQKTEETQCEGTTPRRQKKIKSLFEISKESRCRRRAAHSIVCVKTRNPMSIQEISSILCRSGPVLEPPPNLTPKLSMKPFTNPNINIADARYQSTGAEGSISSWRNVYPPGGRIEYFWLPC